MYMWISAEPQFAASTFTGENDNAAKDVCAIYNLFDNGKNNHSHFSLVSMTRTNLTFCLRIANDIHRFFIL